MTGGRTFQRAAELCVNDLVCIRVPFREPRRLTLQPWAYNMGRGWRWPIARNALVSMGEGVGVEVLQPRTAPRVRAPYRRYHGKLVCTLLANTRQAGHWRAPDRTGGGGGGSQPARCPLPLFPPVGGQVSELTARCATVLTWTGRTPAAGEDDGRGDGESRRWPLGVARVVLDPSSKRGCGQGRASKGSGGIFTANHHYQVVYCTNKRGAVEKIRARVACRTMANGLASVPPSAGLRLWSEVCGLCSVLCTNTQWWVWLVVVADHLRRSSCESFRPRRPWSRVTVIAN